MEVVRGGTETVKIHVGCGTCPLDGYLNVDPFYFDLPGVEKGDAANLPAGDGSAELVFSNAVFEHVFLGHLLPTLAEWDRVLAPGGFVCTIGIPDFERVAYHYLTRGQGITGDRFDLFEAYRYCHGWAEGDSPGFVWRDWKVSEKPDSAPLSWVPQQHKAIFDAELLHGILALAQIDGVVFTYAYPNEPPLNLGFLAGTTDIGRLEEVPHISKWVVPGTVTVKPPGDPSRMAAFAGWHADGQPVSKQG